MKLLIALITCSAFCLAAQPKNESNFFTKAHFSILGGLSSFESGNANGAGYFEVAANLTSYLDLLISAGYYTYTDFNSYEVKTFGYSKIEGVERHFAISYDIDKIHYKIIPLLFGLKLEILQNTISPYLTAKAGINFLDPFLYKSNRMEVAEYNSKSQIPAEYPNPHILDEESYSYSIGMGSTYNITSVIRLDLRYLYKIENVVDDTHQLLIGLGI